MAGYLHKTIGELLKEIDEGRMILPAMQRNFVWPEDKITHFFDSILHDYPIGTFLFWKIEKDIFSEYAFNTFIKDYDEGEEMQRGSVATAEFSDYLAVLDGQQRLTSLYIGLKGKYRTHIKGKKWDDPASYYNRLLCLDIFHNPNEEEDEYRFEFVDEQEVEKLIKKEDGKVEYWVPAAKAMEDIDWSDYTDDLEDKHSEIDKDMRRAARKVLEKLSDVIKLEIHYYEAKDKNLREVVDIFVRVNSGGEKLNSSDLMLSVAAGEQGDVDVHVKMQEAIDEINSAPDDEENGFKVDKELLLAAGLMLTGAETLSLKKQENYSSNKMNEVFKNQWDGIVDAMKSAVLYLEYLGFNGKKMKGRNVILPIAYYFYKNGLSDLHKKNSNRAVCDRIFIRQWLLRTIVNNVFAEGTGSALLQIRNLINKSDKKHFPLEELMQAEIKKPLIIADEQIESIMELKYGDSKIIPIFNELNHEANNPRHQVDHIWAKALLNSKRELKRAYPTITEDEIKRFKEKCHAFANLQLLDVIENQQKSDREFEEWVGTRYPEVSQRAAYFSTHYIPINTSLAFKNFLSFIEEREKLLRKAIQDAFPAEFDILVNNYGLQDKLN